MRHLWAVVTILLLAAPLSPRAARAQQPGDAPDPLVEAMRAVISHRFLAQGDTTRFDACILESFLGGLEALRASLGALAERAFVVAVDPCSEPASRRVDLFGVRHGGTQMAVRVRVLEGETWYFEDYTLRPPPAFIDSPLPWVVDEVRRLPN